VPLGDSPPKTKLQLATYLLTRLVFAGLGVVVVRGREGRHDHQWGMGMFAIILMVVLAVMDVRAYLEERK
jgi:hypothetical protein